LFENILDFCHFIVLLQMSKAEIPNFIRQVNLGKKLIVQVSDSIKDIGKSMETDMN